MRSQVALGDPHRGLGRNGGGQAHALVDGVEGGVVCTEERIAENNQWTCRGGNVESEHGHEAHALHVQGVLRAGQGEGGAADGDGHSGQSGHLGAVDRVLACKREEGGQPEEAADQIAQ